LGNRTKWGIGGIRSHFQVRGCGKQLLWGASAGMWTDMGFLSFLRKAPTVHSPDTADCLALLGLTASAKDFAHAFYQKHYVVIDEALNLCAAIRVQRSSLARILDFTQITPEETAVKIRISLADSFPDVELSDLLDAKMPELLAKIGGLLHDSSCPDRLKLCQWMGEGLEWVPLGRVQGESRLADLAVGESTPG
jgi:hypothetical protein